MTSDPLGDLLDQVARGDAEAAATLFAAYAPYLRALVRRQLSDRLRTKFDSADVVQSVWVQVVRHLGRDGWAVDDEARLRGLLATIARRRLQTRARRFAGAPADERLTGDDFADDAPRPSQVAQANDLWDRLLALCPPEHHEILRLRREGLALEEIAARTGMHEGSVRRILRRLARELALAEEPLPAGEGAR